MESKKDDMTINELAVLIQGEFLGMNERFDRVEGRLDSVEGRLDSVEGRLDGLKSDVKVLQEDMVEVNDRLSRMERKQDAEIERHDRMSLKVEDHANRIGVLEGAGA